MTRKKQRPSRKEERRKRYRLKRKAYILNASMRAEPLEPVKEDHVQVIDNLRQIHEREVKELNDRMLRIHADLDNFRKRTGRERQEIVKFANENMIYNLLPVLDNFYHAVKSMEQSDDPNAIMSGVRLIYDQLIRILKDSGLSAIEAAGKSFDPKFHEAMSISHQEDIPENQVVEVFREGYQLHDRILRPAMVRVNKKSGEDKASGDSAHPAKEIKPEPLNEGKEDAGAS
ncbi:nucleotide exchange factor GrpE [Candidatus Sumerlaeota bacterium]|nr:nucleotide exchange factor GrpE [Candidatus Sumerlaeota bacterium]